MQYEVSMFQVVLQISVTRVRLCKRFCYRKAFVLKKHLLLESKISCAENARNQILYGRRIRVGEVTGNFNQTLNPKPLNP